MCDDYSAFLARKAPIAAACGLAVEADDLPEWLFDFQRDVTAFCLKQGRAGLYLDTGLGKSRCQLEFCARALDATGGMALILTPLAVARQIEREGLSLGYDVRVIREQSDAKLGINICNYDRLDKLDTDAFNVASLDEASILKNFTGKTTRALIEAFRGHRFKLVATATPAPNDHMELGQQAEFLSVMASNEMLMRWFIADQTQMGRYRLKGHGETDFWDWMASWSRMAQSPADLGYDATRFILPPLKVTRHQTYGDVRPAAGSLFAVDTSATAVHDVKRQTIAARADAIAELVGDSPLEPCVVWVDTDYEADAVMERLPEALDVRGSHSIDLKEERLATFTQSDDAVIVTKPRVAGLGLNWQHCSRMVYAGRSFSYEQYYQSVRRCWRFGQTRSVEVHIIVAEGEDQIGRVIDRKAEDHQKMKVAMSAAMQRAMGRSAKLRAAYDPHHMARMPEWIA